MDIFVEGCQANHAMKETQKGSSHEQRKSRLFAAHCHKMFAEIGWSHREVPLFLTIGMSFKGLYGIDY